MWPCGTMRYIHFWIYTHHAQLRAWSVKWFWKGLWGGVLTYICPLYNVKAYVMQYIERGNSVAVGFLRNKWNHSENNEANNKNFLFKCKIWIPFYQFLLMKCHFKNEKKALIHQIQNSKLSSHAKSPLLMCCITYNLCKCSMHYNNLLTLGLYQ